MTPQEINEAVARKLGRIAGVRKRGFAQQQHYDYPDYCRDIAAAWEIMEKVKIISLVPTNRGWHASSSEGQATEDDCIELWYPTNCMTRNEDGCGCCAIADTAPMAICLAFLKLEN